MAASSRFLCRVLVHSSRRTPARRTRFFENPFQQTVAPAKPYTTTSFRRADEDPKNASPSDLSQSDYGTQPPSIALKDIDESELMTPTQPITVADLSSGDRADYETLSKAEQPKYIALKNHSKALMESPQSAEELDAMAERAGFEVDRSDPWDIPPDPKPRLSDLGFWGEDEDDEFGQVEDADDEESNLNVSTIAENQAELQREIRDYTRMAIWDMPLLSSKYGIAGELVHLRTFHPNPPSITSLTHPSLSEFAKPQPTINHAATPLRFRYTTYMGEYHPSARKVVVTFHLPHITPLLPSPLHADKLIKLLGTRYNPETQTAKLSCERFPEPAQNKRYLGDLVNSLIDECKKSGPGVDMFEDIPIDERHHDRMVKKRGIRWGNGRGMVPSLPPAAWNLTDAKKRELLLLRGVIDKQGKRIEDVAGEGRIGHLLPGGEELAQEEYVRMNVRPTAGNSRILDYAEP